MLLQQLEKIFRLKLCDNPSFIADLSRLVDQHGRCAPPAAQAQAAQHSLLSFEALEPANGSTPTQLGQPAAQPLGSQQLGQLGQAQLVSILESVFKNHHVVDQSKTGHYGDLMIKYNGIDCMFEVKNKQHITKEDLDKFEKDAQKFDVSVFVSLM